MQFDSLADALAMAGHGIYVWSVFSLATITVVALLVLPVLRCRRFMRVQRRRQSEG